MKRNTKKIMAIIAFCLLIVLGMGYVVVWGCINEQAVLERIVVAGRGFLIDASQKKLCFPYDDWEPEEDVHFTMQKQWDYVKRSGERKYSDVSVWSVAKNLPDNPPDNLIVLATWNIEPASLRTRFTEEDKHKHIRFNEQFVPPQNTAILKKYAVAIHADGTAIIIPIVPPTSTKAEATTYKYIYRRSMYRRSTPPLEEEEFFDLATDLVNGRKVSYLTPEGKTVVPTND